MTAIKESKILALFSRPSVIIPLLLFLIGISYANTLYSPFVLDDIHSFIEEPNVYVRDFSYESFSKLSSTFFGKARLIPIATFSINHAMAKGQMPIYHITNISIHLLATLVVYWFITTLLRTPVGVSTLRGIPAAWFAFFAAALWALNPVQTNAVTYIVQTNDLNFSAFLYCSFDFLSKRQDWQQLENIVYYFITFLLVMALCAFLSKENSYMLPAAILLVEWMFISPDIFRSNSAENEMVSLGWYIFIVAILLPLVDYRWTRILSRI